MSQSIFDRVKRAFSEFKEESKFYNVRKPIVNYIGSKQDIDTCTCTLHLTKESHEIKVSFDLYYTSNGRTFKLNNKLSYTLFEDCGMAKYIEDELNQSSTFDVGFSFEDLQQLYDEMAVKVIDCVSYKNIKDLCKKRFDKVQVIDRVFYTRVEYYMGNVLVGQIHAGLLDNIPLTKYSDFYPCKTFQLDMNNI